MISLRFHSRHKSCLQYLLKPAIDGELNVINTSTNRQAGFTLIEVIIVTVLFAIMAAVAIPTFMSMLPGMRLNGAARMVMGDLMAARMKAVKDNNRYQVIFNNPSAGQYQIFDDDDNDGNVDTGEAITTRNIQTEYYDVTLSSTANPIFLPRGTATNFPSITLQNSSGSKQITVTIAGRVKIS